MKREEHLHLDIQISKSKETIYLQKTGHFQKKYQHQHQFLQELQFLFCFLSSFEITKNVTLLGGVR